MTKTCKKILTSVFLALLFVVSLVGIVACDKNPSTVTYSVTVEMPDKSPVSDVEVSISKGGATYEAKTTGANGKVTFDLAPDYYDVELDNLPENYVVPDDASLSLTSDSRNLTVTLAKASTYTVALVDENGDPYYSAGVTVGICTMDGNCLIPVELGTNGIAVIHATAGDYKVQINGLPANMTYDQDDHYYTGEYFSATKTEMTITIKELAVATLDFSGTPMTAAEKAAFAQSNWGYSFNPSAQEYDAYMLTMELRAGETGYFYITAALAGNYYVFTDDTMEYAESTFNTDYFSNMFTYKEGQKHTITATNNSGETATATLVMTKPFSNFVKLSAPTNDLALTVGRADASAIVAFTPAATGKYTLTVLGNTSAVVTVSEYEPDALLGELPEDGDYAQGASESFLYSEPYLETTIYFVVTVKADTYPAALNVKLEKTGESVDSKTVVAVSETLTKPAKPDGKELFGIPMANGTADTLTKSDGKYYYNGKQVYVKITEPLESNRYASQYSLAYMDMEYQLAATYVFTKLTDTGSVTRDYRLFIRGFEDYDYTPGMTGNVAHIPETLTQPNCYANFTNADGVYPLTEELETFLKEFFEFNEYSLLWQLPDEAMFSDSAWLFPCYYYDDELIPDDIVGEYMFLSRVKWGDTIKVGDPKQEGGFVTANDYKLVVDKFGTFTVYALYSDNYDMEFNGTWSKDGDTYTFVYSFFGDTTTYSVTFDKEAGYIKLVGDDGDPDTNDGATIWEFGDAVPGDEND